MGHADMVFLYLVPRNFRFAAEISAVARQIEMGGVTRGQVDPFPSFKTPRNISVEQSVARSFWL